MKERSLPPNISLGKETESPKHLLLPLTSFSLHVSIHFLHLQTKKESPTHILQIPTAPTPPLPHALPTHNLRPPPARLPTPASPRPSSPTPAGQPRQPTSTSPALPTLPPPPPPTRRPQSPTSRYTLTWASASAACSC